MLKLMVADDEMIERKVLEKMIRQGCCQVEVICGAENGIEMLRILEQERPDIAVVDINMPGLNGLDAMEIARIKKFPTRFIVVSAYSKFEFAQRAMMFGASEYLLKPVKEIALIQSVEKVCDQIARTKKHTQDGAALMKREKEYLESRGKELISDILLGEVSERSFLKFLGEVNQPFYGGVMITVRQRGCEEKEEIYEKFLENLKKICFCFGKIYKHMLSVCVVASTEIISDGGVEWAREILECLQEELVRKHLQAGISLMKRECTELAAAALESRQAIAGTAEYGVFRYSSESADQEKEVARLLAKCRYELERGETALFLEDAGQMFEKAEQKGLQAVSMGVLTADLLFRTLAVQQPGREMKLFGIRGFGKLFERSEFLTLPESVKECIRTVWGMDCDGERNSYVEESLCYMMAHYGENLSLEMLAARQSISSFYLSRLFKQELDSTFLNILTDIRLLRAMELMRDSEQSVQSICDQTGYQNPSYFYKLIKKQTGMTVNELKKWLR